MTRVIFPYRLRGPHPEETNQELELLSAEEPSKARVVKVTVGETTVSDCFNLPAITSIFSCRVGAFSSQTYNIIKTFPIEWMPVWGRIHRIEKQQPFPSFPLSHCGHPLMSICTPSMAFTKEERNLKL